MLQEWNDELKDVHKLSRALDGELNVCEDKKSRVIDLFIDNKLAEIDNESTKIRMRKAEVNDDVTNKEEIIDSALLFMPHPGKFWNLASLEIKKRVQGTVFPEGLVYDCDKGFGAAKMAESYLLIQEIAQKGDSNPILVAATGFEPVTLGL